MLQRIVPVTFREEIAENVFVLRFECNEIVCSASPGQFVNIRCGDACLPLLRRPFSISRVLGDEVELLFNVVGQGTRMLAGKRVGDSLDVLGPLGLPFNFGADFKTGLIVAGGVGVAPFPFLTSVLRKKGKRIVTFLGARTASQLAPTHLDDIHLATDDGTKGYHGTVVDLLRSYLDQHRVESPRLFGCGPTNMLKALTNVAQEMNIECELSLEGDMACGIGLCQGCPVERTKGERKYALVCVEGPTFNSKDILIP